MYGSQMALHPGLGGPLGTPVVSWAGPELGAVSEIQGRPNMVHVESCPEHAGLFEDIKQVSKTHPYIQGSCCFSDAPWQTHLQTTTLCFRLGC